MLILFHDKKYCNCINFVLCILWDFIVLGLVLSWWKIRLTMKISAIFRLSRKKFVSKVSAKRPHEKYILEAEMSSIRLNFASTSRERSSCEVPAKLYAWRILSAIFLPFTHTIYTLITHKSKRGYSWKL